MPASFEFLQRTREDPAGRTPAARDERARRDLGGAWARWIFALGWPDGAPDALRSGRIMLVSRRMFRLLLEASEAAGIPPEALAAPLGLQASQLRKPGPGLDWAVLVGMLDRLSAILDGDVERIRDVGRNMVPARENAFLQRLAGTAVSPRWLYEIGNRWVAPANFAHIPVAAEFASERRMRLRCEISEGYAPSAAFFHIFEGMLVDLPKLCGLPPATIARSQVSPRALDVTLDIPRSTSPLGRLRRGIGAALRASETVSLLEAQRAALTEGLEALRQAQEESRALLERLPDLVLVHAEGSIVWANGAAFRTLGFERAEDVIGTPLLELVAPSSRPLMLERMHEPPDASRSTELMETLLLAKDGSSVVVEMAPAQRVTFAGAPARLLVGRDVTERIRMQQRLVTADRLASVGLLAAGVAHEVNNPLAYVLNSVEIARKDLAPLGPAAARSHEALGIALEGIDRIRAILRDLLMLARPDEGALGPVDVETVVDSTLSLAAAELGKTTRLVRVHAPAPPARANAARLAQVLLNLIVNALQAMGGRPPEENELVLRTGRGEDGRVFVEVSDNGVGIAPEHVGRIFEPFFSTKPEGRGTGLGLPISQRLVVEIGGEIEVKSMLGKGSTFRVVLPAAGAAPSVAPDRADVLSAPGSGGPRTTGLA